MKYCYVLYILFYFIVMQQQGVAMHVTEEAISMTAEASPTNDFMPRLDQQYKRAQRRSSWTVCTEKITTEYLQSLIASYTITSHSMGNLSDFYKKRIPIDNFHCVQRGLLYRSAQLKPRALKYYLDRYKIKTVINLRTLNDENKAQSKQEEIILASRNIAYHNIPLKAASFSCKKSLIELIHVYQSAEKPILIHCTLGRDRSGEAAALWLLLQEKYDKETVLQQLSAYYGHRTSLLPRKRFFIESWQGVDWLEKEYDPALMENAFLEKNNDTDQLSCDDLDTFELDCDNDNACTFLSLADLEHHFLQKKA